MNFPEKILCRLIRETRDSRSWLSTCLFQQKITFDSLKSNWHSDKSSFGISDAVSQWISSAPILLRNDPLLEPHSFWVTEAEKILQGTTQIYGQLVDLKRSNLWHSDPLTGKDWPARVHYYRYSVFHSSKDGKTDIRRLWELGRFSWALSLSAAYHQTGRKEFAAEWEKYVQTFIEANPPELGPHWLNAMEPAMRALQWMRAWSLFQQHSKSAPFQATSDFSQSFLLSLIQHGTYIRTHLEWTPTGRTNHYIADLVGLLTLAVYLPQWKPASEWKSLAVRELSREIEIQTDSDGFHSEASTAYHHFVTELYTWVSGLDHAHSLGFSSRFHGRVRQMIATDLTLRGHENLDPRIGDDDSSLFLQGTQQPIVLSQLFPWKYPIKSTSYHSHALPVSGIHILRSPAISCFIRCGPNGQEGVGGHAHNDLLSLVIHLKGKPFLVDAGTYCYSADLRARDQFRSAKSHNGLIFGDREPTPLLDWRALRDTARPKVLQWEDLPDKTTFTGQHHGYESLGVIHRRNLTLHKKENKLLVRDEIEPSTTHAFQMFLHLAPHLKEDDIQINGQRIEVAGVCCRFEGNPTINIESSEYSPGYGTKEPHLCLHIQFPSIATSLIPWEIALI